MTAHGDHRYVYFDVRSFALSMKIGGEKMSEIIVVNEVQGITAVQPTDSQLKQLLYNEAMVHNKRFVVMDNDFMVKMLDNYLCVHELSL